MTVPPAPDAALLRWVQSIPAVRCVAPAFRPWTRAKDSAVVPITAVGGERFSRVAFSGGVIAGLTVVAGGGTSETYWLARIPSAHAVVLHAGSEAQEDAFTAVFADASAPPRGFDVVRYEPRPEAASEAEMWFFYRAGVVVALARYEAV